MTHHCFLSLGANQQDPIRALHQAHLYIQQIPGTFIQRSSSVIATPAFGVTQQASFYNQVLEVFTSLPPLLLLKYCQRIEKKMGRCRKIHWGPRLIDIDILIYHPLRIHHPKLTLPHPQIWERAFITKLLSELKDKTNTHVLDFYPARSPI